MCVTPSLAADLGLIKPLIGVQPANVKRVKIGESLERGQCPEHTLGNLLSSSMREMMFMGLMAIMSKASWLSVNSMCCQLMFSRLYSSCSSLKTWRTKNCCRFSFAKLMQSCSKLWKEGQGKVSLDPPKSIFLQHSMLEAMSLDFVNCSVRWL